GVRLRLTRREGWQAAGAEGPARGEECMTSATVSFSLSCGYRSRHVWRRILTVANEEVPLAWLSVSKSCLAQCGGLILPLLLRRSGKNSAPHFPPLRVETYQFPKTR
ncbi:unnamed protein product, partial [Ectocarpus sp. 8 AP-2014]